MKYENEIEVASAQQNNTKSIDKSALEIEKLILERDKIQEELRQLRVPFFRKPAYLGIILPVCVTLSISVMQFKKTTLASLENDKRELNAEKERLVHENSRLDNTLLAMEKLSLDQQREDVKKQITENESKLSAVTTSYREEADSYRARIDALYLSHTAEKTKLSRHNDLLQKKADSLKRLFVMDTTTLGLLRITIKEKEDSLNHVSKKMANLTIQTKLLTKVSKDLKGLLLRFYTNWSANNKGKEYENLRDQLTKARNEISILFTQLNAEYLRADFENMDQAIEDLINDKGAFRKIGAIKNVNYVKKIEDKSNLLIRKLEKEL
jgi:hypothetical protein